MWGIMHKSFSTSYSTCTLRLPQEVICVVKRDMQEIADADFRSWQNTLNVSLNS